MNVRTVGRQIGRGARVASRAAAPLLVRGLGLLAGRGRDLPDVGTIPPGEVLDLPGRGRTYVVDVPGPTPDAPTVLLLHGIATTGCLTWFSVLGELAKSYRVITFDQRWHGRGIPSDTFAIDDCADDAAAVLAALGIERVVVVGYSMGGATAQVLWQRYPERVAGLVLCSTAARWQGNLGERAFYAFLGAVNRGLLSGAPEKVRLHLEALPPAPAEAASIRAWAVAELRSTSPWSLPFVLAELGRFDSSPWIGGVRVPVAVVITARDRAIPTARQRQLAALIPHALVRESPGGHASLVFDRQWQPIFLEALADVVDRTVTVDERD